MSFICKINKTNEAKKASLFATFVTDERETDGDNPIPEVVYTPQEPYTLFINAAPMSNKEATQRDLNEMVEYINKNNSKSLEVNNKIKGINIFVGSNGSTYSYSIKNKSNGSSVPYIDSDGTVNSKPGLGDSPVNVVITINATKGGETSSMSIDDFVLNPYTKEEVFEYMNNTFVLDSIKDKFWNNIKGRNSRRDLIYQSLNFNTEDEEYIDLNISPIEDKSFTGIISSDFASNVKIRVSISRIINANSNDCKYLASDDSDASIKAGFAAAGSLVTDKLTYANMINDTVLSPTWTSTDTVTAEYSSTNKYFVTNYSATFATTIHPNAESNMPIYIISEPFYVLGKIYLIVDDEQSDTYINLNSANASNSLCSLRFRSSHISFEDIANLIKSIFEFKVFGYNHNGIRYGNNYSSNRNARVTTYNGELNGVRKIAIPISRSIQGDASLNGGQGVGSIISQAINIEGNDITTIKKKYGFPDLTALNRGIKLEISKANNEDNTISINVVNETVGNFCDISTTSTSVSEALIAFTFTFAGDNQSGIYNLNPCNPALAGSVNDGLVGDFGSNSHTLILSGNNSGNTSNNGGKITIVYEDTQSQVEPEQEDEENPEENS